MPRAPRVFGGRSTAGEQGEQSLDMQAQPERVATLAARVERLVTLRHTAIAERRLAVVLFNLSAELGRHRYSSQSVRIQVFV